MHEESLIRSLLRQVEDLARQHQAVSIEEIEVEIGPLSGAEPLLLQSAFARLRETTPCWNAALVIVEVQLEVVCQECQAASQLEKFRFVCAHCGSTALQIVRGDEIRLLNVKLQIQDPVPAYNT